MEVWHYLYLLCGSVGLPLPFIWECGTTFIFYVPLSSAARSTHNLSGSVAQNFMSYLLRLPPRLYNDSTPPPTWVYRRQFRRLFLALSHGVQPSESADHVFNIYQHRLIFAPCSCQRSTLAYTEQFPAKLCSFDVIGCFLFIHTFRH